jgi:hypothetical protein
MPGFAQVSSGSLVTQLQPEIARGARFVVSGSVAYETSNGIR